MQKTKLLREMAANSENATIQESAEDDRRRVVKEPTKRECVQVLSSSSHDFIEFISPQTVVVKDNLKIPLLMITFSTGLISAMTQAFFKFHGEILQSGKLGFFSGFELTLLIFSLGLSIILLAMLNVGI